jgi:hypothetical protein
MENPQKYLIYELFSGVGFCNQLFSFETAIYLSLVLNRKLILIIKYPLCHCGKASWNYGNFINYFDKDILNNLLKYGFEVIYKNDNIPDKYKYKESKNNIIFPKDQSNKFSSIVFVDKNLNTITNLDIINNFCAGRQKIIFDIGELEKYENIYIIKSNASRIFYNFFTTKNNYILMNKISQNLTKFNPIIKNIKNEIKENIKSILPEKFLSIHFRFGDYQKNTEEINKNNLIYNNSLKSFITLYNIKNIIVISDRKDNTILDNLMENYNLIFTDDIINQLIKKKENLLIKNNLSVEIVSFLIELNLVLHSEDFIGTYTSTVSNYIHYRRFLKNTYLKSNYLNKEINNLDNNDLNRNIFTWNKNNFVGHPISWSCFFPDNIYLCDKNLNYIGL